MREGEVLAGKYKLEKRLGAGGMGEVYRALNTVIGRQVAIKLLRAEHATNPDLVARFMTEARAANLVRHPNVVDILDVGQTDEGAPFLVQELLEGIDLAAYVASKGKLSEAEALRVMVPIVEAVGFAHEKGVVHRDLKPDNVFLAETANGMVPKLLDFGISRVRAGEGETRLTVTGVAMGTPAYMSPEQVMGGKSVDARADVWALGVLLYEIVSGRLPFRAESSGEMFVRIATVDPIPLEKAAPGASPDLVRIVARCLRRDRHERFPNAAELARELRSMRGSAPDSRSQMGAATTVHAGPARPAKKPPRPPAPVPESSVDVSLPSGLNLVTLRPPRATAARRLSLRPADWGDARGAFALLGIGAIVVVVGGTLAAANPIAGGWPLARWLAPVLASAPAVANGAAVVALVAAMALAVASARRAWSAWRDDALGSRTSAVLAAAFVGVCLFAALELARGLDAVPTP